MSRNGRATRPLSRAPAIRTVRDALLNRQETLRLNQSESARRIGVSKSVYCKWVSLHSPVLPSLSKLDAIAAFLDVAPSDVMALYPATYTFKTARGAAAAEDLRAIREEVRELREIVDSLVETIERLTT